MIINIVNLFSLIFNTIKFTSSKWWGLTFYTLKNILENSLLFKFVSLYIKDKGEHININNFEQYFYTEVYGSKVQQLNWIIVIVF